MTSYLFIHNDSSNPCEHAKASIMYIINHMIQYPLTHAKRKEILTIISIHKNHMSETKPPRKNAKKKTITFTYFRQETKATINLFRSTHIGIAYRSRRESK
jgi:hypothetical protein